MSGNFRAIVIRARGCCLALCVAVCAACAAAPSPSTNDDRSLEARYLDDASFRRRALVDSLVAPANGYSQLRLARYASGDALDWDRAPVWNPAVGAVGLDEPPRALDLSAPDLGEEAFFRYPIQVVAAPPAGNETYGLWRDERRGLGGVVRFALADGSAGYALTCSSCHARAGSDAALVVGAPNASLDLGRMLFDEKSAENPALLSWGPGRVDVTTSLGDEPVRIADLRPVRFLSHLHADATVTQHDVVALAIRIETLIITSRNGLLRPPREVSLALAKYVQALADAAPPIPTEGRGREVFEERCASCHASSGMTGAPVALAVVGTDAKIGLSRDRGTGTYRVPSLRFVSTRGPLLHDASIPSLDALFDPSRLVGANAVKGHEFGLDLDPEDRAALLSFLHVL